MGQSCIVAPGLILLMTRSSVTCSTFSQDTSILAAGFTESYIRLWNIKGDRLKGMRSDFQLSSIKDCTPFACPLCTAADSHCDSKLA